AKVNNSVVRKRKAVTLDLNTKFVTIKEIEAGKVKSGIDESSASDLPSEAESCIIVASKGG
ncbi:hypothetical protein LY76DRAFT_528029, partial [Colletotrichum caudatum]